jgi:hypothetical protein
MQRFVMDLYIKYKNLSDGKKSALIGCVLIVFLIIMLNYSSNKRTEKLDKHGFLTFGIVEKLRPNQIKGKTTREDVVYFYFIVNDTVFHEIKSIPLNEIENKEIELDKGFELKILKEDYTVNKINFNKPIDTFVSKYKFHIHKYLSNRHKNIVENIN